jgi:hypothetical protein
MTKQKNEVDILNDIIKEIIYKIDTKADDMELKISILLKLCDIALKVKKLEEDTNLEEDFTNYNFKEAELAIIEDYLKQLKKNL